MVEGAIALERWAKGREGGWEGGGAYIRRWRDKEGEAEAADAGVGMRIKGEEEKEEEEEEEGEDAAMRLLSSNPSRRLRELGVGGLDGAFQEIFRR